MDFYIYAKSGHQVGLDSLKRAVAIYKALSSYDPTLLVTDFRAGEFAKNFGVNRYVSVDVAKNIANVAQRGDVLIYDSDEVGENFIKEMTDYFSLFIRVDIDNFGKFDPKEITIGRDGANINGAIIDKDYFTKKETIYDMALFFGDDDYYNILVNSFNDDSKISTPLLLGHYFLFENESILESKFDTLIEEDEYLEVVSSTKYLITSSLQAVLESIAFGNSPIYFQREDKKESDLDVIRSLGVPIIEFSSIEKLINDSKELTKSYPIIKSTTTVIDDIVDFVDNFTSQDPYRTILESKSIY
jgi:hypothetical protein